MGTKSYTKEDLTILWTPSKCIHSAICVKGLPNVFKPKEKPWITTENASKEELIAQVKQCPSGALAIEGETMVSASAKAAVQQNGPLIVEGPIEIIHIDGTKESKAKAAFCRCGASKAKPYCDGSHGQSGFTG